MRVSLSQLIRLARPFDALYPVISLCLGAAVAGQLSSPTVYVLIVVVVLLNSVAMIWNDIEDREVDADNGRAELATSDTELLRQLKISTGLLAATSILLSWWVGFAVLILSLATVATIWAYNSKPIQASRRPIASIVVLSGAGAFLPYLFGLSLASISSLSVLAGVLWWIGRMSLSILKDYQDAQGDARHHKKTFLLCYGARRVAQISVGCLLIGYGGFIVLMSLQGADSIWPLPALFVAIAALLYLRRSLFASKGGYSQLGASFRQIVQYQLLLDAGIVLWLI